MVWIHLIVVSELQLTGVMQGLIVRSSVGVPVISVLELSVQMSEVLLQDVLLHVVYLD